MMDNIRWWLWPGNPRLFYLIAGGLLMGGFQLAILSLILAEAWQIALVFGTLGWFSLMCGVTLIHWQRRREEESLFANAIKQQHQMEMRLLEAARYIANIVNDESEAAGNGRPVSVHNISIH